mgnify:CR=1 FL=1
MIMAMAMVMPTVMAAEGETGMARPRMAWLLAAALLLAGCSGDPRPRPVPLMALHAQPSSFHGETVTTEGVVRRFEDPLHYWIEDEQVRRVAVVPADAVADHLGQRVRITGRFTHDAEQGRRLQPQQVEVLDD